MLSVYAPTALAFSSAIFDVASGFPGGQGGDVVGEDVFDDVAAGAFSLH